MVRKPLNWWAALLAAGLLVIVAPFGARTAAAQEGAGANTVRATDQTVAAGNTVTVAQVSAAVPGWMVIHASDTNGAPGPVIGWTAVPAGESTNVVVPIDVPRATRTLHAMLHVDAGTIGVYEFPGPDVPAREAGGAIAMMPFVFSANDVVVMDQVVREDNIVTVAQVQSTQEGWLVIHANANGSPGPVLGWAHVGPGQNNNVNVVISPTGRTDTMFAMLHVDLGTQHLYEFPGADVPARDADGEMVTPPFDLVKNAVKVNNQSVGLDGTVVVEEIIAERDGWMVIHAENESGGIGPVIGHALVKAGINRNIAVSVDTNRVTPTMYAMLHVDLGAVGVYEFPGADVPVLDADGMMVSPPFGVLN